MNRSSVPKAAAVQRGHATRATVLVILLLQVVALLRALRQQMRGAAPEPPRRDLPERR